VKLIFGLLFLNLSLSFGIHAQAEPLFGPSEALPRAVQEDLSQILKKAALPQDSIQWTHEDTSFAVLNTVHVSCPSAGHLKLEVHSASQEWVSTFYYGLQKIGFLFPHPRIQINPNRDQLTAACGQTWVWKPRLEYRGFHLHMEHPNEWVHGFLMGQTEIATDTIRWLARNQQNVVNLMLLRQEDEIIQRNLIKPLKLAKELGIHVGINVSFTSLQQKSFYLARPLLSFETYQTRIVRATQELIDLLPFDFLSVDMGSTEFTSSNFRETLAWINATNVVLRKSGRRLFMKAHVSIGQTDPHYGNFNFLSAWSSADVGVFPHSVLDFSLQDAVAPVYGRHNLEDMKEFVLKEKSVRPTWYFPETSYFVGMDIDVPLLLTDYLKARSQDMDFLEDNHVQGQVTFSTGQELGYWLMDWTVALLANGEYRARPLIGLELLGEDLRVWTKILDFQTKYFKDADLLALLSSSTLLDELPFVQPIYQRVILRNLKDDPALILSQTDLLLRALSDLPDLSGVRNPELKSILQTTWDRLQHAYLLRAALAFEPGSEARFAILDRAKAVRKEARDRMDQFVLHFSRYPEALIFDEQSNPTSYQFGYGWPAKTLHFWEREEKMIRKDDYSPWFMNIYSVVGLLT
jgi:hypothetical protein